MFKKFVIVFIIKDKINRNISNLFYKIFLIIKLYSQIYRKKILY